MIINPMLNLELPLRRIFYLLVLMVFFLSGCEAEKPQGIAPQKEKFTVSPNSAFPGSTITLSGLDLRGVKTNDIRVLIDDKDVPFYRLGNGNLEAVAPVYIINGKISSPQYNLKVQVKDGDRNIDEIINGLTLIDRPSTNSQVLEPFLDAYQQVVENLNTIFQGLALSPDIDDQYATAVLGALQNIVNNDFASVINIIKTSDADTKTLTETLLKNSGAVDRIKLLADFTRNVDISTNAVSPAQLQLSQNNSLNEDGVDKSSAIEISDDLLARRMQFANVLSTFNSDVIDTDARSFSLTGGAGFSAAAINEARLLAANVSVVDFAISKLLVAMFPTRIDDFSLDFASLRLFPGEVTNTETQIRVINEPAPLNVADFVALIINTLNIENVNNAEEIRRALNQAANSFFNVVYQQLGSAADLIAYPPKAWWAVIDNPNFLIMRTDDESRLKGLTDRNEWQAIGTNYGQVEVFAETSALSDAAVFSFPLGMTFRSGAFGADVAQSGSDFPQIFSSLFLDMDVPVDLKKGETAELKLRAGYKVSNEQINWKQGLQVVLTATDGELGKAKGVTDSDGYFSTSVRVDEDKSQMQISITVTDPVNSNQFAQSVNVSTVTGLGQVTLAGRLSGVSAIANGYILGDVAENNIASKETGSQADLSFNESLDQSSSQSSLSVNASSTAHVEHNTTVDHSDGIVTAIRGQLASAVSASVSDESEVDFKYTDANTRNYLSFTFQATEHTAYEFNATNLAFNSLALVDRFVVRLTRTDENLVLFEFNADQISEMPEALHHQGVLDAVTLYTLDIDIATSADARSACQCGNASSHLEFELRFGNQ